MHTQLHVFQLLTVRAVQGVANRDIKLENTLLDGTTKPLIKICDFGYSKHEKFQSEPGSRVGTPAYLAPEVILTTRGKTYDGKVCPLALCMPKKRSANCSSLGKCSCCLHLVPNLG